MDTILLNINNLSFKYKNSKYLFTDFSASVNAGMFIAVLGANGAGKSTLLKMLSGIERVSSGDIFIRNKSIQEMSAGYLAKQVSYSGTGRHKLPYTTVRQYITLGKFPYRTFFKHNSDDISIDKIIKQSNLELFEHKQVNTLSDGEYQRVNIARVLAQETPLILFDEPAAFLDFETKHKVYKHLKSICAEQLKTIILATHDLNEVLRFADELWLIKDEKFTCGNPYELIENKIFESFFSEEVIYDSKIKKLYFP